MDLRIWTLIRTAQRATRRKSGAAFLSFRPCENSNQCMNSHSGPCSVLRFELTAWWLPAQNSDHRPLTVAAEEASALTDANRADNRMDRNRRWEWNSRRISLLVQIYWNLLCNFVAWGIKKKKLSSDCSYIRLTRSCTVYAKGFYMDVIRWELHGCSHVPSFQSRNKTKGFHGMHSAINVSLPNHIQTALSHYTTSALNT